MALCYFCHWGWAPDVNAIFDKAVTELGGNDNALVFGPSHVVWGDENFDDDNVAFCLGLCDTETERSEWEIRIVRRSLEALRACAIAHRVPPAGFTASDQESPGDFPPPWSARRPR